MVTLLGILGRLAVESAQGIGYAAWKAARELRCRVLMCDRHDRDGLLARCERLELELEARRSLDQFMARERERRVAS